jgi:predicted lipase
LIAANSDWESINLTGYSLGASIAMFVGHLLVRDSYANVKMINFAQPRNGDNDFAAFSNEQWADQIRFTNNKDIYS